MADLEQQSNKVFLSLSLSSDDALIGATLAKELRALGIDVWISNERVGGGAFYARDIESAIRASDALLVLASSHSVGNPGSSHVQTEIQLALEGGRRLIPLALDSTLPKKQLGPGFGYQLITAQYIDLRGSILTGSYGDSCRLISVSIRGGSDAPALQPHAAVLDRAERQLAHGEWLQARETLMSPGFQGADLQRAKFLRIVAQLQSATPLHRLQTFAADSYVAHLNALRGTAEEPAVLYVLAVLSRVYYEFNALRDPTGGVANLKRASRTSGRLKARALDAIGPLLPNRRAFELEWKRGDR